MRRIRLLGNRVLVRRADEVDTLQSGLVLPREARERPNIGTVVAVGSKVRDLSVGEDVIFLKYTDNARRVIIDDETLWMFEDVELYAALSK